MAGLELINFRTASVIQENSLPAEYDSLLGWHHSHFSIEYITRLNMGIRRRPERAHVRTGEVLVLGASFTQGREVD